jgi:hypothetical protein
MDDASAALSLARGLGAISQSRYDARVVNGASFGERLEWLERAGLRFAYVSEDGELLPLNFWTACTLERQPEAVGVVEAETWDRIARVHRPFCDVIRARQIREVLA